MGMKAGMVGMKERVMEMRGRKLPTPRGRTGSVWGTGKPPLSAGEHPVAEGAVGHLLRHRCPRQGARRVRGAGPPGAPVPVGLPGRCWPGAGRALRPEGRGVASRPGSLCRAHRSLFKATPEWLFLTLFPAR